MDFDFVIEVPDDMFMIVHEFKPEDWAPGVWLGTEGLRFKVASVDPDKRIVILVVDRKNEDYGI